MIPEMPSANWEDKLPEIFAYSKWFIAENQAFVMIGVAIALAMTIMVVIVNLFDRSKGDEDDDDGYDYRPM